MPQVHTAPKESFGQGIPLGKDSLGASPRTNLSSLSLEVILNYQFETDFKILIFREFLKHSILAV